MSDQTGGQIKFKGQPMELAGSARKVGDSLPDVTLKGAGLKDVSLSDYRGKVCILSVVPSLDTPTCDTQTRQFNKQAATLGDDAVMLAVSMDLPFAQARWCGAADADNIVTLSDYKDRAFGQAAGLYIENLGLLARSVIVADREGVIRYIQVVDEVTEEPDYDKPLQVARDLA